MRKIASVILGFLVIWTASAAMNAPVTAASTLTQRIAERRAERLQKRGSSSSSSSAATIIRTRPSRRSSSSSSYSYTGTPVRGVLQIDQISAGTSQQIVGTVPYTLLAFDATAGNEDIVFSTVKFHAEQGDLSSGTQYTLNMVNADGTLAPVAYATSSADILAFTNIDTVLRRDTTQRFVLQGRLLASDASLAVGFLKTDPLFVQAQGMQYGRDLAPGIQVDNTPCNGPYVCRVVVHTQPALLLYK